MTEPTINSDFSESEKEGFYKAIYGRRDVRGQFLDKKIPENVLHRVLNAAHHAPSVGFMQPWNFLVIDDLKIKEKVHQNFLKANEEAKKLFEGERREKYSSLKLEGILESPINICVTCDRERMGDVVLGRTTNRDTDLFSTACAIQNLWLAARVENLGLGWVSIVHNETLREILNIPNTVVPMAYLCIGYVSEFLEEPELQLEGWQDRLSIEDLIFKNQWGISR